MSDKLQEILDAQIGLIVCYLKVANKNIDADTLMAQDYQLMAKEAAATVEILQRIILIDQLSQTNVAALRDRFNLPPTLKVSFGDGIYADQ